MLRRVWTNARRPILASSDRAAQPNGSARYDLSLVPPAGAGPSHPNTCRASAITEWMVSRSITSSIRRSSCSSRPRLPSAGSADIAVITAFNAASNDVTHSGFLSVRSQRAQLSSALARRL